MYRITEEDVISKKNKITTMWLLEPVNRFSEKFLEKEAFSILSDEGKKSLLVYIFNRMSFLSSSTIKQRVNSRLKNINIAYALFPKMAEQDEIQSCEVQVAEELSKNYEAFFAKEAPLFLDRLNESIDRTMSAFEDMFMNIQEYRKDISERLLKVPDFGLINKIEGTAKKSNSNGHNTLILTADKGTFVYKHRDSRIDVWAKSTFDKYFKEWIIVPECLAVKDCFGFFEFIENRPAETVEEAKKFYYNLGVLTAVFQMFGSADFHRNNILAKNVYPIPIDLEMILFPKTYESVSKSIFDINSKAGYELDVDNSAMQLALMPFVMKNGVDIGTLTGTEGNPIAPVINGQMYNVLDFEDDYFNGFEDGYQTCMEISSDLLKDIDTISGYTLRRSFRTNDYYYYRFSTYVSGKGSDINVWGTQFEGKRLFEKYESRCIENADIPHFITTASSTDLFSEDRELLSPDFFYKSAIDSFITHVNRMCKEEMQFEENILKSMLSMRFIPSDESACGDNVQASKVEAINNAKSVLWQLDKSALVSPSKELFWMYYMPFYGVMITDGSLDGGHMGIALFCSSCYKVLTSKEDKILAKRLCSECMKAVERIIEYWEEYPPIKDSKDYDELSNFLEALRLVGNNLNEDKYIEMYENLYKKLISDDISSKEPVEFKITKCSIPIFNPSFRYGDIGIAYDMICKAFGSETGE